MQISILPPSPFPNKGCEQAFNCGKEFFLAGLGADKLNEALSFCDNQLEVLWFIRGIEAEAADLIIAEAKS